MFDDGEENFQNALKPQKAKAVREAIQKIESAQDRPKLKVWNSSVTLHNAAAILPSSISSIIHC